MCCSSQINIKRSIITHMFLICFISVSLLSEIFILSCANHEHDYNSVGDSCTICAQIHNIKNLQKQFDIAVNNVSSTFISFLFAMVILYSVSSLVRIHTLVDLKVRMDN